MKWGKVQQALDWAEEHGSTQDIEKLDMIFESVMNNLLFDTIKTPNPKSLNWKTEVDKLFRKKEKYKKCRNSEFGKNETMKSFVMRTNNICKKTN